MAILLATCVGAATQAQAVTIDFDTDAFGNPLVVDGFFANTNPLRELYAPLGIHFGSGAPNNDGGGILNQSGNFGVNARSGTNLLAFNTTSTYFLGATARGPEVMTFDTEIVALSLYASGGFFTGTATLQAFSPLNVLLDTDVLNLPTGNNYALMDVSAPGIARVVLTYTGNCCAVFDDLSFTPAAAPEPGTLALFGLGLGFAGWARRRQLVR